MVKNLPTNARDIRDTGLTPGSGRSHEGGQPTPSFLPRESHEQRSLEGCVSWGRSESGSTDSGFWYGNMFADKCFPWRAVEGCCSVMQWCPTLCDPIDCSTPGFPVLHYFPEFARTHIHCVSDAIQPSQLLSPPSPPVFNLSQHQGHFQ